MQKRKSSFREKNLFFCFSSYKNLELKVKLWSIEARKRRKRNVYFSRRKFILTFVFYHNVWGTE